VDFLHQNDVPFEAPSTLPPLSVPERQGTVKRTPQEGELTSMSDKMWEAYVQYMEELIINNENGSNDPFLCRELFDIKIEDGSVRSVAVLYNTEAADVVNTVVQPLATESKTPLNPSQFCLVERNEENHLERLISPDEYVLAIVLSWVQPEKMSFVLKSVTPKIEERRKSKPVRVRQTRHIMEREELLKQKEKQQTM